MDIFSRELHSLLVKMGMEPGGVDGQTVHYMEHLLALLGPDDEESLTRYYGLFGTTRLALADIARDRAMTDEDMMARIDDCVRRLAVTPEWQMMRSYVV